ncbi:MAG: hypothetical protein A4S09_04905 [Proteobacteria bacterium SG_bin7]|nr:MAG: hypothetical protein A4S09_04905 [Proteobacteria bacterium SG_bin7]
MKTIGFIVSIFVSWTAIAGDAKPNKAAHIAELEKIWNSAKGNKPDVQATKCLQFVNLLHKHTFGNEFSEIKTRKKAKVVYMTTGFNLPSLDDFSEEEYNLVHNLFQTCRFFASKSVAPVFYEYERPIDRMITEVSVLQKLSDTKFIGVVDKRVYIYGQPVKTIGQNLVVRPVEPITDSGGILVFPINAGSERHKMLNGFDKDIQVVLDLGPERTSAVMCRWAEYMKTMKKKYKNEFKCGFKLDAPMFGDTDDFSFACVPSKAVKAEGFVQKGLYIREFDWPHCR